MINVIIKGSTTAVNIEKNTQTNFFLGEIFRFLNGKSNENYHYNHYDSERKSTTIDIMELPTKQTNN